MRIVASLLLVALIIAGCGKKGALIYPDMLIPAAPTAVSVRQTGQALKLSFAVTRKDRAGRSLKNLGGVVIFKRTALVGQGPTCNACTEDFALFKKLYLEPAPLERGAQRFGDMFVLLDGDVQIGDEYGYIVKPFTQDAVDGQASAPVTAAMVAPPQPPKLKAEPDPIEIQLLFEGTPEGKGTLVGYNLYRTLKGGVLPYVPLNKEPITGKSYVDSGIDRTVTFVYAARTIVKMPGGALVESELSNEVETRVTNE